MPSYEIIPYEDQGTGNDVIWYQPPTAPIVGDNFDFTVALTYSNRDYAIGAILEKSRNLIKCCIIYKYS
ncbi:hypothetical protein DPMN_176243 [Dreissena polymorpha]|uniref:Uncharacterized protein n=1 Tax=Dreissena polymorpha TaxID=45954 RepID=A0A9D4E966_DREPO|nr:hypothetical protein DPMN_176243 [Dreissena polymorpha]